MPDESDLVGLIRLQAVLGPAVLMREDGDRLGTHFVRRAKGSDGDLAAVGHQDFRNMGPRLVGAPVHARDGRHV